MTAIKTQVFKTLALKLIESPINLRAVERYYAQYEADNLSKNYAAFDKSAYIDIYEIMLNEPQKGTRLDVTMQVDIYLNTLISAQSLIIQNSNFPFKNESLQDWELEQTLIKTLHESNGTGVRNIKFNKSVEFQRYDQLLVKKLSFTLLTCAFS